MTQKSNKVLILTQLSGIKKAVFSGIVVHNYNPSSETAETGGFEVKVSLGYRA